MDKKKFNARNITLDVETLEEFKEKNQHLRTENNDPASHPEMGFEIFEKDRQDAMVKHFGWKIESWD